MSADASSRSSRPARADVVIAHAVIVTMNDAREILADGAVAIAGDHIVDVGPTADVDARTVGTERIDASRHVLVPGLVNAHIHITGEPLTRGYVPDDVPFEENVFGWLSPLGACATEHDERLAAQLAAAEMLRTGTTAFLEAGTGWYLDAVAEALVDVGIRARVGRRIWDLPEQPAKFRQSTDAAIANLAAGLQRHRSHAGGRVKATAILVGHATCSDDLWRAARQLADEYGAGLSFHMSPASSDPEAFLARTGHRPFDHLDRLGVLAADTTAVHCVYVDEGEIEILAARGCNVVHCPTTALKVAYGVTTIGKFPEMLTAGVHVCLGTDGNNASNYSDLMRATYLAAGLFKDARRDPTLIPAEHALELATLGGARALLADDEIGSIEVGKRADLVLHDRDRPEWTPLHNVVSQLVWSADGRSVDTVFVDGRKVVDHGHLTTLDEERLFAEAQRAGSDLVARSGLPNRTRWPIVGQLSRTAVDDSDWNWKMLEQTAAAVNETVVREYLDAIGRREPDRIVSFVTDDYTSVHISVRGTGLTGRGAYRSRLDVFLADFPELEYEVIDLIATADRVAVDYWMRGRYAGAGVDRAPFEIRGAFWFVMRDGLIAHRVDYRDSATFERQVGLTPS